MVGFCERIGFYAIIAACLNPGGGVLPYQSGGGVPPESHGAHGERERNQEIYGHQEIIIEL